MQDKNEAYTKVELADEDVEMLAHALVRAMIPKVRYEPFDELAMAREASRAQSYEVKTALLSMLDTGVFGHMGDFVMSAINEYDSR